MKGVVDGAVLNRAISISAIVNDRICALPVSSAAAEMSRPASRKREIGAVAIADVDPFDSHVERHKSFEAVNRDGEIWITQGLPDFSTEPRFSELRLQNCENSNEG